MAKSTQQSIETQPLVKNKDEVIQEEINSILRKNPYLKTDQDEDLHGWLDKQRKLKLCGLVVEDKGSNLLRSH